jgi:predicted deacetylase
MRNQFAHGRDMRATEMTPNSAQYLIRFDDLCPTMLRDRCERFLAILERFGVTPILAVVPDNHDPELTLRNPDPGFWDRMRSLQSAGATIAMHGYRHLCVSRGKSFLSLNQQTEFAGVEESQQRQWIRSGLNILRGNGLSPRLFVAPRHGFDRNTLSALASEDLAVLSDGFAHRPFTRHGVQWIPQQLWEPVRKNAGLWTICIHTNTATLALENKLETFLEEYRHQFTSFDPVIGDCPPTPLRWGERMGEAAANLRVQLSRRRFRLKR